MIQRSQLHLWLLHGNDNASTKWPLLAKHVMNDRGCTFWQLQSVRSVVCMCALAMPAYCCISWFNFCIQQHFSATQFLLLDYWMQFGCTSCAQLLWHVVGHCKWSLLMWDVSQEVITLETAAVKEATANILEMHSIPATTSKDLIEAKPWQQCTCYVWDMSLLLHGAATCCVVSLQIKGGRLLGG